MRESRLASLVRAGKPAVGGWINLCDPGVAIIYANSGYDWVLVDNEHNPFTEQQIQSLILALRGSSVTPVIRVRGNDPSHIKWVLDCGAGGILVPMIENADDARRAVDAAKYQPLGNRGYSPLRATDFWQDTQDYNTRANDEVLLICQIECLGALRDVEEIAQIPGIDAIFVGPADLAHSMGYLGQASRPEVQAAVQSIIDAANKHGKPWGTVVRASEDLMRNVDRGATVMLLGSDTFFISSASAALVKSAREAMAAAGKRETD